MTLRLALVVEGDASGAKKAAEEAKRAIGGIGTAAKGGAAEVSAASQQIAAGISAAGAAAGRAAGVAGAGAGRAAQLSSQQLVNMQMQMQDMGVMLASGQSPFMLMMQQGSQIVQMFGPGVGVAAALKAVGAGFVTFLTSPLNLALLGFAAAAGAASWFFRTVLSGAEDSGNALERHDELIRRIKEDWPEAAEGARAYARESAAVLQTQLGVTAQALKDQLAAMTDYLLADLGTTVRNTAEGFVESGDFYAFPEFDAFAEPIRRLSEEAAAGEPDIRAFRRAVAEIAATDPENRALQQLAARVLELTEEALKNQAALAEDEDAIRRLGAAASGELQAVQDFGDALKALSGIALPDLSDRARAAEEFRKALGNASGTEERQVAMEAYERTLGRIADEEARVAAERAKRSGAANARAIDAERRSVEDLIGSLSEELALMQLAEPERRVQEALRHAGAAATAAEREEIRKLVEGIHAQEQAQSTLQQVQAETIQKLDETRNAATGIFSGIANDIQNGTKAGQIFRNVLGQIGSYFTSLGSRALSSALFGAPGTTGAGAIGSLVSGLFGNPLAGLAAGGIVTAPTYFAYGGGRLGVMGEAGPEAVVPLTRTGGTYAIGAVGAAGETALPLTRLGSGRLGVALGGGARPFAVGDIFDGPSGAPPIPASARGGPSPWAGAGGAAVNNFFVQTPNPRAFREDRASLIRGGSRLLAQSGRFA